MAAIWTRKAHAGTRAGAASLHQAPGTTPAAGGLLRSSATLVGRGWSWLALNRSRVLAPYVRRPALSRLNRTLMALALLAFCFIYGSAFALFAPVFVVLFLIPPAVLGLLVVWALPETKSPPVRTLGALFVAVLVLMVLWPNYLAVSLLGLPRITLLRLTGAPMALCLLVCISVSQQFRKQLSAVLAASPFLWRTLLAFAALQAVSIAFSTSRTSSLNIFFNMAISWYAVFLAGSLVFAQEKNAQRFAELVGAMALALALLGLWEHHLQQLPWVGHIPSFLRIDDPIVEKILAGTSRGRGHRVQGPFTTALGLSEYFGLAMPFLLYLATSPRAPWKRLLAAAAIPLVIYATVLTQARTGLLGILIAFLLYPLLMAWLHWRRHRHSMAAAAALVFSPLLLLIGMALALIVPGIRIRLLGGGIERYSNQGRFDQWHMGIPKILTHPWGHGVGGGAAALGYTNVAGFLTIDSYPLRLALEYGVVGVAVYYAFNVIALIYVGARTWTPDRDENHASLYLPVGIAIASFAAMQINFAQEENSSVMFMIYGLLTGMLYASARSAAGRSSGAPS